MDGPPVHPLDGSNHSCLSLHGCPVLPDQRRLLVHTLNLPSLCCKHLRRQQRCEGCLGLCRCARGTADVQGHWHRRGREPVGRSHCRVCWTIGRLILELGEEVEGEESICCLSVRYVDGCAVCLHHSWTIVNARKTSSRIVL